MTDKIRTAQTDAGPIEFLNGVIVGGRQRMKQAKRLSAGVTIGGLRIAVAVHGYPTRKVTIKVGDYTVYTADWNEQSLATATGIIASMLGESELDHCKYLTQALVEVEL